jgi:hypothetical protein
VAGYDLLTGWGSPTCQLLDQLSSATPLTADTILNEGVVQIITGKDDLGTSSAGTACVTFTSQPNNCIPIGTVGQNGAAFLKTPGNTSYEAGDLEPYPFVLPASLGNITPSTIAAGMGGIESITLGLEQDLGCLSNIPTTCDNWDIGALSVRLFNPKAVGEVCQFDAVDTISKLFNTNDPGVARLSGSNGTSGSGPSVTLTATGCAPTGSPTPASPAQAQFIISTASDPIRGDSSAQLEVFGTAADGSADQSVPAFLQSSLPTGGQEGDVFNIFLDVPAGAPPPSTWQMILTLNSHNSFIETDDHWDVGAVNVMTWAANGLPQCVMQTTGSGAIHQLNGSSTPFIATMCH